jgi:hypothetical protein
MGVNAKGGKEELVKLEWTENGISVEAMIKKNLEAH